jgi:hypothetical protein
VARRFLFSCAVALAFLGVPGPVSADTAMGPGAQSWADHVHGWRVGGKADGAGFFPELQASDNGGRSWRTIYRSSTARVGIILRTSATAGIVTVEHTGGRMLVTLDGGKRWHPLAKGLFWPYLDGAGRDLFVLGGPRGALRALYRVTNWPSVAPRKRLEAVVAAPFSEFWGGPLHMIPGGVAAVELGSGSTPFGLLVDRNGKPRLFRPQPVDDTGSVSCGVSSFSVNWPAVTVVTEWAAPREHDSCGAIVQPIVYSSSNGGRTWSVTGSPPTSP